jgi:hypothetical protein
MTQPALFPSVNVPAPRRRAVRQPPPPPAWEAVWSAHEEALRQDRDVRGTGRAQEIAFRAALQAVATSYATAMPPLLYGAVMDHLTRVDGQGLSLCFHGPLRERLLADVCAWLETTDAGAGAARALRQGPVPS